MRILPRLQRLNTYLAATSFSGAAEARPVWEKTVLGQHFDAFLEAMVTSLPKVGNLAENSRQESLSACCHYHVGDARGGFAAFAASDQTKTTF